MAERTSFAGKGRRSSWPSITEATRSGNVPVGRTVEPSMASCRRSLVFVAVAALGQAVPRAARGDEPSLPSAPPPPSPSAADVAPAVTEVTVQGRRPDPTQTTLGTRQLRELPGAFGDAFRSVEAFPGVTPMATGLPYFFIRGAPPGDTGCFVDGVRVPLLFHAAFGPSVIHPGLVERLEFFPGGAPVQFGRFAGGILSAEVPPPSTIAHAEGSVRVFDAGALAEAPLGDDRGSALVAGRYSYSGLLLSLTSPLKLSYWDYQTREIWRIGDHDRIGIFAFGSYDDFGQVRSGVTDTIIDGEFHRVDLRYDHDLDRGSLRVATTLGFGKANNDGGSVRDLTLGVRATLEERISPAVGARAGADVTLDRYDLLGSSATSPAQQMVTDLLYPTHLDLAVGGYADVVWRIAPRLEIVPGLRADLFTSHRHDEPRAEQAALGQPVTAVRDSALPAIDPRLSVRASLHPDVTWIGMVAVAQQPAAFVVPIPGLTFVEPNPVLQTALQTSQGLAVALPGDVVVQATGFLHSYLDMTDLTATCPSVFGSGVLLGNAPGITDNLCLTQHVRGRAFGGELLVRRDLGKRLSGWIAYTLSRSTREAPLSGTLGAGPVVDTLASFDRTHVVNVVASYDLGARWRAGARFVAYTGLPYSNTRFGVPVAPYDGARMPAFYRIDLRLEKRWSLGTSSTIALVFEGMNVTLNREVLAAHCSPENGQTAAGLDRCTFDTLGPVSVPSVGVEAFF
jgi:TonB dependent receptor/TonB-dependent Receptor Plug Domain